MPSDAGKLLGTLPVFLKCVILYRGRHLACYYKYICHIIRLFMNLGAKLLKIYLISKISKIHIKCLDNSKNPPTFAPQNHDMVPWPSG